MEPPENQVSSKRLLGSSSKYIAGGGKYPFGRKESNDTIMGGVCSRNALSSRQRGTNSRVSSILTSEPQITDFMNYSINISKGIFILL